MKQFLLSTINDILKGAKPPLGTLVDIHPRQLAPLFGLQHWGKMQPPLLSNEAEIIRYVHKQALLKNQEVRNIKVHWTSMTVRYQYKSLNQTQWRGERLMIIPFQPEITD
ncbi:hypothetical protein GCM10028806_33300 [Spirosoma terrae]|uniref:Uncharacterized protein n=1 Tax=Spirosoma terrae TaxID=1968276 RepID=A0A6L9L4U5_9BACT|nr:hypothetical protein [Spirosoma terrae]NDU95645.1 hypothetical protein [Spirosoma terrae]